MPLTYFCYLSGRLQIWGIMSTCENLSAVKAVYFLQASLIFKNNDYVPELKPIVNSKNAIRAIFAQLLS